MRKVSNLGSSNQVNGAPSYDGIQPDWVQESINLSDYIRSNILIRFRFVSDNGQIADSFYFDDLKVSVVLPTPLSSNNFNFASLRISPNPATPSLKLNNISGIENYKIYNVSGQLLYQNEMINPKIDVDFLSDGIYFLELKNKESKKVMKFVVKK